ncbi:MAG: twin-arginine translocase TatA/TatE family subunit [Bacteroidaceae bacterium]|nr:twin-arginine translocase TatA/TatE family subunit [Bacteroidales bacterium]MCF0184879.1 twin-arginine translocase TatA/TatE family subunit [Bacteroidaceae bacterium]
MILPLILGLSTWELIAIVAVILLLFGAKRIPSIMRNIGKGVNSFKKGVTELQDEIENGTESSESIDKGSEENK